MLPLEITFADFTLDGFPTISLICFVSILILAVLAARGSSSFGVNNNGGIPLLAFSVWFVFCAVFFVFTPVSTVQRIGIHLFLIGAAGAYTVLSGEQNSLKFFIVFSALTLICMIGSAAFFGYFDIWSRISPADCYAVGNDRCTKGYLTWIRIIAAFDMYLLLFAIVIALSGYKA